MRALASLFPVVLMDVGLFVAFVGMASLVKPIAFLGIASRPRAGGWLLVGALFILVAILWPAQEIHVAEPRNILDRATPSYQFSESHAIAIRATPERVHHAIRDVTADEILLFRTLVWIRRLGRSGPESILNVPERQPLLDVATRTSFILLTDTGREIVLGTVVISPPGLRWRGLPTPGDFVALGQRSGVALATMNFEIAQEGGTSIVTTETRVYATDSTSRRRFAAYWRLIYPGSTFIRRMWLRAIKKRAEGSL